jgi:hypothetical protein
MSPSFVSIMIERVVWRAKNVRGNFMEISDKVGKNRKQWYVENKLKKE